MHSESGYGGWSRERATVVEGCGGLVVEGFMGALQVF